MLIGVNGEALELPQPLQHGLTLRGSHRPAPLAEAGHVVAVLVNTAEIRRLDSSPDAEEGVAREIRRCRLDRQRPVGSQQQPQAKKAAP